MIFFIYSRKSVYTGKGESIENQIEMCKQYIHANFEDVAESDIVIYEDEGFSAKNTNRPQFQKMLHDIGVHKPGYIVCYRLDRISRNVSDFSALIEDLNNRHISFICIKEKFDTSNPMGKAMMYIASVFAQLERETIAERVRDNMMMLSRTGRWLGGTTPTGYVSEKQQEIIIDGKIKTSCRLKENHDELHVVFTMFEKFLELRTVSAVSKFLIRQGIKSRTGKIYSLLGIKQILQNPVYCTADEAAFDYFCEHQSDVCFDRAACTSKYGLLAYNKRDYRLKSAPRQSMDKWIVAIGKHKGLVSGEKWVEVQAIIENNIPTGKAPSKMHNDYSLLSGLIYCEKCGSRMFAKHRSGKGANSELYDYVCNNKLRGGTALCDCQNINGQQADDMVLEYLMKYADESSDISRRLRKLKENIKEQSPDKRLFDIDAQIKRCDKEIENLVRTLSQSELNDALINNINIKVESLDTERKKLVEQRASTEQGKTDISDKTAQIDLLISTLGSLKTYYKDLSTAEKRTLIKILTQKIVWDGENLHIFIYGE